MKSPNVLHCYYIIILCTLRFPKGNFFLGTQGCSWGTDVDFDKIEADSLGALAKDNVVECCLLVSFQ